MTMDRHDKDSLDHWLTTDPRDNEPDEADETNEREDEFPVECSHAYISWHGSRGECQDCGEIISAPNPETDAILTKLFDQWREDIQKERGQ